MGDFRNSSSREKLANEPKETSFTGLLHLFLAMLLVSICAGVVTVTVLPSPHINQREDYTKSNIVEIEKALKFSQMNNGRFPTSEEGLDILTKRGKTGGPYIKEIKADGWNRPLHYISDGTTYKIISYGANGKIGGEGYDSDIVVSNRK